MRFLSIEVALGLCALALLASFVIGVEVPPAWFFVVPPVCWAVYTIDRILDSKNPEGAPDTGRHDFHRRHKVVLSLVAALSIATAVVVSVLYFPIEYWFAAVPLGALTLLHVVLQRTHSFAMSLVKDLNVVVTYTLSAWAIPIVDGAMQMKLVIDTEVWIAVFACTVLLVLIDVVILSQLDARQDAIAGRPSIAVALGEDRSRNVALFLCLLVFALAGFVLGKGLLAVGSALIAMALAYMALSFRTPRNVDNARLLVESVLVLPLLLPLL